jgi:hypothetical protein
LSGRRGASRHDDARGGGGDTGRKPEEAGAVGIIVVEENWRWTLGPWVTGVGLESIEVRVDEAKLTGEGEAPSAWRMAWLETL